MVNNNQPYEDTFDYAFNEDGSGGFNSQNDLEIIVNHIAKPIAPSMTESYQDVPARYGGVYLGTDYGEKEIDIPITIMCEDRDEYNRKLMNLTNALINLDDDPMLQHPLRFNDNPDVMYYGHFTEIPTPTFINDGVQDCQTTLTFMLADPRGFGVTQRVEVTDNDQTITAQGNAKVNPIIHIIPKTDLYYFGYETNDEYVAVGYNVNDGNTITDADGNITVMGQHQTLQVNDPCTTMATWFESGSDTQVVKPYMGTIDGTATATGTSLMVAKDKDGHYNWGTKGKHGDFYGPVIVHNGLPKITPFWKASVRLHHVKYTGPHNSRAMGKVEAYLLNNDGEICARMGIEDPSHGRMPLAYIQLGHSFDSTKDAGDYKSIFFNRGNPKQHVNDKKTTVKIPLSKVKIKKGTSKTKKSTKATLNRAYHKMDLQTFAVKKKKKKKEKIKFVHDFTYNKAAKKVAKKHTKTISVADVGKYVNMVPKPTSRTSSTKNKKYKQTVVDEYSYNNRDAYSDFWGEFTLEHYRKDDGTGNSKNMFKASIVQWDLKSGEPYSATDGKHTDFTKTVTDDGKFSFSLANVAVFFGKHDITEDKASPVVPYKSCFETLTSYKEWRSDGSNDPDDVPHIIAHAGEEILIDTADENVTCSGRSLNKYVSWLSTFPSLTGGVPQTLHFAPSPAEADIYVEYRPAYK